MNLEIAFGGESVATHIAFVRSFTGMRSENKFYSENISAASDKIFSCKNILIVKSFGNARKIFYKNN